VKPSIPRPRIVVLRQIVLPLLGSLVLCVLSAPAFSTDDVANSAAEGRQTKSGLYLRVQLGRSVRTSKLKLGDVISGRLALDVYSGTQELFPKGSEVRLTVDKLARRKRVPNDHWPWVIKFFTPRHENYPTFSSAAVNAPQGHPTNLQVSVIAISPKVEVHAAAKVHSARDEAASPGQKKSSKERKLPPAVMIALEAETPQSDDSNPASQTAESPPRTAAAPQLPAGTQAKVVLLDSISASKSQPGERLVARLIEPVRVGGAMALPEGTLLEGKVVARTPPRMLSRPGSVLLTFTQLQLPKETGIPISASVSAAELDQRSRTKIDPEGKLRGDPPGKAWMLINIGTTAGIAKVADDGTQLVIEAIVSTATDASTAGTARIVATGASGLFLLTRHGRDVVLPRFTEMNIVFDRSVELPPSGSQAQPGK